jgi:3-hydroxyacyl-CoA dehydrogenase
VFWARERGAEALVKDMDELADLSGAGFVRGDLRHVLRQSE